MKNTVVTSHIHSHTRLRHTSTHDVAAKKIVKYLYTGSSRGNIDEFDLRKLLFPSLECNVYTSEGKQLSSKFSDDPFLFIEKCNKITKNTNMWSGSRGKVMGGGGAPSTKSRRRHPQIDGGGDAAG